MDLDKYQIIVESRLLNNPNTMKSVIEKLISLNKLDTSSNANNKLLLWLAGKSLNDLIGIKSDGSSIPLSGSKIIDLVALFNTKDGKLTYVTKSDNALKIKTHTLK